MGRLIGGVCAQCHGVTQVWYLTLSSLKVCLGFISETIKCKTGAGYWFGCRCTRSSCEFYLTFLFKINIFIDDCPQLYSHEELSSNFIKTYVYAIQTCA